MLNYLDAGSHSDIAYAAHQCAWFAAEPKVEHGKAVQWLGRYLKGTRNKGMTFKPGRTHLLEIYVDTDFTGNWNKEVFQYAAQVCKMQFVMASRPHAVLDMRPSTTNNSTSNQDHEFTALTRSTLVSGPYWIPNEHHKIANKPRPSVIQLWACCVIHIMTRSSYPSSRPIMT